MQVGPVLLALVLALAELVALELLVTSRVLLSPMPKVAWVVQEEMPTRKAQRELQIQVKAALVAVVSLRLVYQPSLAVQAAQAS